MHCMDLERRMTPSPDQGIRTAQLAHHELTVTLTSLSNALNYLRRHRTLIKLSPCVVASNFQMTTVSFQKIFVSDSKSRL